MALRDLIFSLSDNRGVGYDRDPVEGEYMRRWENDQCAWFFSTPRRYEWTGTELAEFTGWQAEQDAAALAAAQAQMTAAIIAEEDRRTWLPIEYPAGSGVMHKATEAISNTIDRLWGMAAGDALPINNGYWDDVNGNPVPFTFGNLVALRNAIYDRGAYNYGVRKYHIAAMLAAENPLAYDYSGGWA